MSDTQTIHTRTVAVRFQDDPKTPTLTGYAATFDTPYQVHDWLGTYTESVARGAFAQSIATGADVRLLVNHDGLPLARTTSGTLHLSEDDRGLKVHAELDPTDPDVQRLLPKMRRGDVSQMSFGFIVPDGGDDWNQNYTERTVTRADLHDVSVVTYPANPATSASVRKRNTMTRTVNPETYATFDNVPDDLAEHVRQGAIEHGASSPGIAVAHWAAQDDNVRGARAYVDHLEDQVKNGLASEKRAAEKLLPAARALRQFHDDYQAAARSEARSMAANVVTTGQTRAVSANGYHADGSQYRATAYVGAEQIYRPDGEYSFFRDLAGTRSGDYSAMQRLDQNNQINAHNRAVSTATGSGGAWTPPLWLVDEWIRLARPRRVTANLGQQLLLPGGASSINIPKVASGTSVGIQQTQNTSISNTDITSTSVSSSISVIAGQQIVSLQTLAQSPIGFDRVILSDLAAAYAAELNAQVISGTGTNGQLRGILTGTYSTVTYTTSAPAVVSTTAAASFYNYVVKAINTVHTTRYEAPNAIIMHPRRWSWILQALDNNNRPLVLSEGGEYPTIGTNAQPVALGVAGQLANLPVYVDPSIPTTLGVATNQDVVMVAKVDDWYLYETPIELQTFDAPYANQLSVLFRAHAYSAFIPDRQSTTTAVITGTGLTAPTTL